jgi:putative holliday junction resolvase
MISIHIFPILALDIGSKRIGVAYMEQLSGAADSRSVIHRKSNLALNQIISIIESKQILTLVVGIPMGTLQQRTPQCLDVESFCRRIERRCKVNIVYVDEYLSSVEAQKTGARGEIVDDKAAEIILKRYLVEQKLLPDFV